MMTIRFATSILTVPAKYFETLSTNNSYNQYHDARFVSDFFHRYLLLKRGLLVPLAMRAFLISFEDLEPGDKRQHLSPGFT